ncbi:NAD(P)/FAD-dependent oxidoreductase [Streptomyces sp. NBC_00878]|uniref:FAD-dependent oxidoreductase n=1 Tax=Streptomyces sp. NBC_00878 TaxID=2975854 RepID=UPI0022572965|nr:FAD-dependent oxidoreductase [Streptomyces sp. NBC_00878]MCX4908983.1 FAD-dependent oxidoreductase [Streptomyces sp. NBC_00878]
MKIVVIGAGVVGLTTALLLAQDRHQVVVVDRDTAAPADANAWERPGVTQFRHPHIMMPRACQLLATELPPVLEELMARGGRTHNMIAGAWRLPAVGGRLPGDERFDTIAVRRPVIEAALTAVALRHPYLTIHRDTPVTELLTGTDRILGRPHITGVLTRYDKVLDADLFVDAAGRNSPVSKMLTDVGAPRPVEDHADTGFRLYTRYFRSTDGTLPAQAAWPLDHHDSVSTITVPGDSDTWALSLVVSGRDQALRALRSESAWQRAAALYPNVAHWATTGEPISGVLAMSGTESRIRRFVRDGRPVATGLVSVGDAWAATNPQFGLGMAMGMTHAAMLRDLLRTTGPDETEKLALAFDEVTHTTLAPIHQALADWDRHRLAQIDGGISGVPYETQDPDWNFRQLLEAAKLRDPELLRATGDVASMLATPDEALAPPGLPERVVLLGGGAPRYPEPGPSRAELLEAIGA